MYQLHLTLSICFLSHISFLFNFFLQVSLLSSIFIITTILVSYLPQLSKLFFLLLDKESIYCRRRGAVIAFEPMVIVNRRHLLGLFFSQEQSVLDNCNIREGFDFTFNYVYKKNPLWCYNLLTRISSASLILVLPFPATLSSHHGTIMPICLAE